MKKNILLVTISLFILSCQNNKQVNKYGDQTITMLNTIEGSQLRTILSTKDSIQTKIIGKINAICQKKGCWMEMDLGDNQNILIRFKDYGFFVPMNAVGKTAIVEGVARVDTLSIEWLKHQLDDANASQEEIDAIINPEISYTIEEATGVIIK